MKDRFKFRVWDKQDECYAYSNNSDVDILYIETDGELTYGTYNNDYEDMYYTPESEVIVEQCTGLKDKKGKLIFEGDILAVPYIDPIFMQPVNMEINNDAAYVEFYKGCFVAHYPEKQRKYLYDYENIAEVIGNIHENPDLLEQCDVEKD